jgi:hypothetical protein
MATIKQKLAFKEVVKGSTLTKAMSVAGYSPSAVKRTNKLTETDGWHELMAKHLPDSALAKKHRELLNKREYITIDGDSEDIGPETQAVSKALDMAYKLKGRYSDESREGNKTLIINISGQSAKRYGLDT